MRRDGHNRVLVFNPGSASLKFELVSCVPPVPETVRGATVLHGVVEPINDGAKLSLSDDGGKTTQENLIVKDHGDAASQVLARIPSGQIDVVGQRVVHGADRYTGPVLIDDDVVRTIEELKELAPIHNASALAVIKAVRAVLGSETPQVAVFDTAFHRTLPDYARFYALPWELTQRHGIQRFGFHGTSHRYLMLRYAELTGTPVDRTNIITLHLEGGSSATLISGGKSIDTSMGFTPLEGLMMSTRSGDIDPALVGFLMRKEKADAAAIEKRLNKESGLLGVSGHSGDTRELVRQMDNDQVRLALDMFAYRVRKCIGAYLAAAGDVAAIVFGGGIGENTPYVRQRICERLDWFGLDFDADRNASTIDREGRITQEGSRLRAYVIPTRENLMIAHEAMLCCIDARTAKT